MRKCIPIPAGGDNAGLIDMAIMTEEFYSERHLDDVGDCARSLANLVGRYVGAGQPIAEAILEEEWSAASRVFLRRMLPSATSPRPTRPKLCRERTEAQARAFKVACWPLLSIYDAKEVETVDVLTVAIVGLCMALGAAGLIVAVCGAIYLAIKGLF